MTNSKEPSFWVALSFYMERIWKLLSEIFQVFY